ncbi:MAG: NAD(P)H-dependent oxidoreductase subunit E [Bacteroidales bacterium]|nr:NAD(P)H-dependent oxidoreductase subunit E [Bacteroidales bacterium]
MEATLQKIVEKYGKDSARLMDILYDVQVEFNCVSDKAVEKLAELLNISEVDVEQTRSFYHFFSKRPAGKYSVYLNNSAVAVMMGANEIAKTFEQETGVKFGEVAADGSIGLHMTADIGMNDQEPAALINGVVFTSLNATKVKELVAGMKAGKNVQDMVTSFGDGNNANELMKTMVKNNIMNDGPVLFNPYEVGVGLKKAVEMDPKAIINEVKTSAIRGRGGAGFPTGMKWDFCSQAAGDKKYVVCNADEGEPGTFKDRVLLTEKAEMLFEGMAIGGYAVGADEGILYLRAEYRYMQKFLENVLAQMRSKNMLGNVMGKFKFDIRIQFGAGAYVCGEETALIESAEGKRGEPRNKPPFPVQHGYMNKPTIVNNVETFCAVSRIMEKGGAWYKAIGTAESSGTKLLSISGDCAKPGVYEVVWGMTVKEMLALCGADVAKTQAVQIAGPSGVCINPSQFDRKIAIEDLPTGGSMIVVGNQRNLLKDLSLNFMEFMMDESCGSCAPCRALNVILKEKLEKVISGKGITKDIADLEEWSNTLSKTTRCGLGQTSSNPIATTLKNFRNKYEELVKDVDYQSEFDMAASVKDSCAIVGRTPKFHH